MFIDYYVIKKGNLRLLDLFTGNPSSRYWFYSGVNYRAVGTVVVALLPCLPSFAAQIDDKHLGFSATARSFFYISFVFTYSFAAVLYYCSYLVFPERGDNVVERQMGWEQWANENDEEERAAITVGLAEDEMSDGNDSEKKAGARDHVKGVSG